MTGETALSPTTAPGSARVARTRRRLIDAALTMLDAADARGDLSVADLARMAGVSRPTFYQHFGDTATLIRVAALTRLDHAFRQVPAEALGDSWTAFAGSTIRTLLTELCANRTFYLRTLNGCASDALMNDVIDYLADRLLNASPLGPIIRRHPGPDTAEDRAAFLAAGVVWHVRRWLERTTSQDEIESVGEVLILLLRASGANADELAAAGAAAQAQPPEVAP